MEKSKRQVLLIICVVFVILFFVGLFVYGCFFRDSASNMIDCPKCDECPDDTLNVENNIVYTKYWKEKDGKYVEDTSKLTAFASYRTYSDEDNEFLTIYLYGNGKSLYWDDEDEVTGSEDEYFKDSHLIKNFSSKIKTIDVVYFKGQSEDDLRAVIVLLENGEVYISDFIKEKDSNFYKSENSYKKSSINNVLEIVTKNSFDTSCADGIGCYLDYVYALDNTGNYYYLLKGYYE